MVAFIQKNVQVLAALAKAILDLVVALVPSLSGNVIVAFIMGELSSLIVPAAPAAA